MTEVAIVIVTYNSAGVIGACLESLRAYVPDAEVIVVDNASSDGTLALIAREHPWMRVIRRAKNGGLSAAVNDGVAAANGRYIMALNPDTRLVDDAIAPLHASPLLVRVALLLTTLYCGFEVKDAHVR